MSLRDELPLSADEVPLFKAFRALVRVAAYVTKAETEDDLNRVVDSTGLQSEVIVDLATKLKSIPEWNANFCQPLRAALRKRSLSFRGDTEDLLCDWYTDFRSTVEGEARLQQLERMFSV